MFMRRFFSLAVACLLVCTLLPGCAAAKTGGLRLHETPQVYVLQGEDTSGLMPTVTLYENGNAWLSQPLISSWAIAGIGSYRVNGRELTVTHGSGPSATFEISDGGDTLTLKSASIGFTRIGSIYRYRSSADTLRQYTHVDGEKLTVDILRKLADQPSALSVSDFAKYAHYDKDPDDHIYDIEGRYTLRILVDGDGKTTFTVERNSSGETFPLALNKSTGYVFDAFLGMATVPAYEAKKWLDFLHGEQMPWGQSIEMTLPEFPGVSFTWTSEKVTANGKTLFEGMPVWNVYLYDLTNDGKPELCATVSFGSGIVDTRVIVYDCASGKEYQLSDRMSYDYALSMQDGQVMVTETAFNGGKPLVTAPLRLVNGEIFRFGCEKESE